MIAFQKFRLEYPFNTMTNEEQKRLYEIYIKGCIDGFDDCRKDKKKYSDSYFKLQCYIKECGNKEDEAFWIITDENNRKENGETK